MKEFISTLSTRTSLTVDEAIVNIGDVFHLLEEFKNTKQDAGWHAEGDVHIHTDMVLEELFKVFENKEFEPTPSEKRVLILSALLHDIAKPITTHVREGGRIGARGHEDAGMNYLVFRLLTLDLPHTEYVQILKLVGLHQRPKMLVIQNCGDHKFLQLNNEVSYELLYWLEVADMRGRISEDTDTNLMFLEEFYNRSKMVIKQQEERNILSNCYLETPLLVQDYCNSVGNYHIHKGNITHLESAYKKFWDVSKKYSNVKILCGISGTGKSTYTEELLSEDKDLEIICMDEIRAVVGKNRADQSKNEEVYIIARERLVDSLRKKKNVVWDATNTRKDYRKKILTLCENYKAKAEIHVLLTTVEIAKNRNKGREFQVPESVIDRQVERFQLPFSYETHEVFYKVVK